MSDEWTSIRVKKETADILKAMQLKNYDVAIRTLIDQVDRLEKTVEWIG